MICKNQRQKIRKNKSIKIKELTEIKKENYINELKNAISFNTNSNSWEINSFDSDLIFKEDTPLISKIKRFILFRNELGGDFNRIF